MPGSGASFTAITVPKRENYMDDYAEIFKDIDAGRVLDVGTGNGYFLELLLKDVKSYSEAVGVDMKEAAAEGFNGTFKENDRVSFKVMDAAHLDFPDESFDTVCISHSLHHLADPTVILSEMKRVLFPGGWFIINEMYRDGEQSETQQTHILLHHWLAAVDTLNHIIHNETYKREELVGFANRIGLNDIRTFDIAGVADDPHDPETVNELTAVIDRYIQRAEGRPDLQEFGGTMRARLGAIGFHSASVLLLLAKK